MFLLRISLFSIFLIGVLSESPLIPDVDTVSGRVIGSVAHDGDYYEFLGIPYADSTSGTHRFKVITIITHKVIINLLHT
jgi:hypothetical protein